MKVRNLVSEWFKNAISDLSVWHLLPLLYESLDMDLLYITNEVKMPNVVSERFRNAILYISLLSFVPPLWIFGYWFAFKNEVKMLKS